LVGSNKIKDEWQKINTGFDLVQADMDEKADASDLAILQDAVTNHIGSGGNAHAEATDQQAGFMSAADKQKLDGIEVGAEKNQNAFSKVNDVEASDPSDELTITGGTGIAVTTNPNTKEVIVTATGSSTPGPHGSSHTEHGADPIPAATTTEGGLMSAEHVQMLESHASKLDAATSTATPNTIVQRDSAGRFKAAAPSASDDVARKAETDAALTAAQNAQATADAALPAASFPIETGMFTPYLAGVTTAGSNTYSLQRGFYIRHGKLVRIDVVVIISAKDPEMAGLLYIGGLPFAARMQEWKFIPLTIGRFDFVTYGTAKEIVAYIDAGTSANNQIRFYKINENSSVTSVTAADIGNTTRIHVGGVYEIA
jgi:hypothetical protein